MSGPDHRCRLADFAIAAPADKPLMLGSPSHSDPSAVALSVGVLWGLILLSVGIEALLQAADFGLVGSPLWRGVAYQNGAFWAGLLRNWRPNYPGQPLAMFLSYAFFHDGLGHLAGNMLSLWLLGRRLIDKLGAKAFLVLYLSAAFGGGVGFGLLSQSPHPMVGASGALFGLAGAAIWLEATERHRLAITLWPIGGVILGLIMLNALMWLALDGILAWQTHLGGFVTGVALCAVRTGTARRDRNAT